MLQGSAGCGDDGAGAGPNTPRDSGGDGDGDGDGDGNGDGDGDGPPPPVNTDSGIEPGEPPEELMGESCAADTNKVYEISSSMGAALPAQLGVDLIRSRFAMTFVSAEGAECSNALQFAEIYGASGAHDPEVQIAYDGCTLIERAAIIRSEDAWLIAVVDNRMDARDLWVHAYDAETGETDETHRITESDATKESIALLAIDAERAMIAWAQTAMDGSGASLHVRMLSRTGEPAGDEVVLEAPGPLIFSNLSLARFGEHFIGLSYRRDEGGGAAALVLDVLDIETAERDRDPWVLTTEPGTPGSIEIDADENGAGVVYTLAQADSRTVWFQVLDSNGYAARVMSGIQVGGPIEPTRIVSNPQRGVDVSVAKLPVGFAVAYRALPSVGIEVPQVRVHFLDRLGTIIGDSSVALATEGGGQTAIEAGYDGRIALSWTDNDEEGNSTLRTLIMPCAGGS